MATATATAAAALAWIPMSQESTKLEQPEMSGSGLGEYFTP